MKNNKLSITHLLSVDPSLSCSGWTKFAFPSGKLEAAGVLKSLPAKHVLDIRLKNLQHQISDLYDEISVDNKTLVICEGPAHLVLNPQSSLKVERVRTIFETLARERSAVVPGRVNPRTVHTEVLGLRGKQVARTEVKRIAAEYALKLYGSSFKELFGERRVSQDILDAALIGTVALGRIRFSMGDLDKIFNSFGGDLGLGAGNSDSGFQTRGRKRSWRNVAVNSPDLKIRE